MTCSVLMYTQLKAQAINAGYQARFQRPVTLHNFPTLGPNAYTAEEIKWCKSTIDYLEGRLSDEARLVRSMPAARRTRGGRAAPAALSPVPPSKPLHQRHKSTPRPMMTRKMTILGLW